MKAACTQRKKKASRCRQTREAFDHVTLYACTTLPISPNNRPLGPPSDPARHRGNIPDAALFHNSHHVCVCFFPLFRPWRIPLRRGAQLGLIATRLSPCATWTREKAVKDSEGSFWLRLHPEIKLGKRAGCWFKLVTWSVGPEHAEWNYIPTWVVMLILVTDELTSTESDFKVSVELRFTAEGGQSVHSAPLVELHLI